MHISEENVMDEYLFITMAKLKADRLQLEREQRAAAELPVEPFNPSATHSARQAPTRRWFSRAPQWREQS
jgi:hypothetical protein